RTTHKGGSSGPQLLLEQRDDRHVTTRPLPRVTDPVVVDHADGVGRDAERVADDTREVDGLEVVAERDEALQPVPQRAERALLVTELQRVGRRARGQL